MQVLLALDTTNTHHRKIIRGVTTYAHDAKGWALHLMHDPHQGLLYRDQDPLEKQLILDLWQADGIIAAFTSRENTDALSKAKVPVVGIEPDFGWGEQVAHIPSFSTDNRAIARLVAQDLIARGFRQLAFCGVPTTRFTGWSAQREVAFAECAAEAGVPCDIFPTDSAKGKGVSKVHERLLAWVDSLTKPVGLMACYDVRAFHVLDACRQLGLLVPEDVAVIGVDNDEMLTELSNPPLSSVEQGAKKIGYEAAILLDQLIAGKKAPELRIQVEPERLVTRRSSDFWAIEDAYVSEALKYIREHACEGIQVADVVRAVAVSRSTLESHFRNAMGRTLHAEIQRVQMECARRLVATTDLPLKEVATAAGFSYVQHMTTLFRQHMGQTPAQYRKHARSG
ncbi:MAG: DNA-binding transcriptional regulator [Pirellulales bacterium]|nr:DNA-binding transcriptional regulator [Pirellulales bacterium]